MAGGGHKDIDVNIWFSGSCYSYGTMGPCYELCPRGDDFSLYDVYAKARRTGEVDPKFIDEWMKGYPPADEYSSHFQRPSVEMMLHFLKSKPDGVRTRCLQYTNGRGVRLDTPDGQTFLDEWHRDAFPTRKWPFNSAVWYDLDPVESFRDYAMWLYHYGHDLDPRAPIKLPLFTPPLIGYTQMANFKVLSLPGPGTLLLGVAWLLGPAILWLERRAARAEAVGAPRAGVRTDAA